MVGSNDPDMQNGNSTISFGNNSSIDGIRGSNPQSNTRVEKTVNITKVINQQADPFMNQPVPQNQPNFIQNGQNQPNFI